MKKISKILFGLIIIAIGVILTYGSAPNIIKRIIAEHDPIFCFISIFLFTGMLGFITLGLMILLKVFVPNNKIIKRYFEEK